MLSVAMSLPVELLDLKVEQLREECSARGIVHKALTKSQLISAIVSFDHEESGKTLLAGNGDITDDIDSPADGGRMDNSGGVENDHSGDSVHLKMLALKLDHEYRMRQLEVTAQANLAQSSFDRNDHSICKSPKLPTFHEGEDVEMYLAMFERVALGNKWESSTWATRLASLLTGKAREAYVRMDLLDSSSYDKLKIAILDRYDLTPESYRRKFRKIRKVGDETFKEWGIRARKYFERWMGSSVNSTKAMSELLIMEQLLESTTPELQLWLRDHDPQNVEELIRLADIYRLSRQDISRFKNDRKDFQKYQKPMVVEKSVENKFQTEGKRAQVDKMKYVTCFKCHSRGHYQSNCPKNQSVESFSKAKATGLCHSPSRVTNSFRKHCKDGKVNGRYVTMLMDSGSNCSLVQEQYLDGNAIVPNKHMEVDLADGSVVKLPVAMVHLTGSNCSGEFEVGVLKAHAPFEVIIGHDSEHIFKEDECDRFVLAVTRAQAQLQQERQSKIDKAIALSDVTVKPLVIDNQLVDSCDKLSVFTDNIDERVLLQENLVKLFLRQLMMSILMILLVHNKQLFCQMYTLML